MRFVALSVFFDLACDVDRRLGNFGIGETSRRVSPAEHPSHAASRLSSDARQRVDNFTAYAMTEDEAIAYGVEQWGRRTAEEKVKNAVEDGPLFKAFNTTDVF